MRIFFCILFSCIFSASFAQPVTGVWRGKMLKGKGMFASAGNLELKLIKRGDSLLGTSYYYMNTKNFVRYSVKGYFDLENNAVHWWDDQLLSAAVDARGGGAYKNTMHSVADFNCPGSGVMKLDGQSNLGPEGPFFEVHLDKVRIPVFKDEWDPVIAGYFEGMADPKIIDSVWTVASVSPPDLIKGYEITSNKKLNKQRVITEPGTDKTIAATDRPVEIDEKAAVAIAKNTPPKIVATPPVQDVAVQKPPVQHSSPAGNTLVAKDSQLIAKAVIPALPISDVKVAEPPIGSVVAGTSVKDAKTIEEKKTATGIAIVNKPVAKDSQLIAKTNVPVLPKSDKQVAEPPVRSVVAGTSVKDAQTVEEKKAAAGIAIVNKPVAKDSQLIAKTNLPVLPKSDKQVAEPSIGSVVAGTSVKDAKTVEEKKTATGIAIVNKPVEKDSQLIAKTNLPALPKSGVKVSAPPVGSEVAVKNVKEGKTIEERKSTVSGTVVNKPVVPPTVPAAKPADIARVQVPVKQPAAQAPATPAKQSSAVAKAVMPSASKTTTVPVATQQPVSQPAIKAEPPVVRTGVSVARQGDATPVAKPIETKTIVAADTKKAEPSVAIAAVPQPVKTGIMEQEFLNRKKVIQTEIPIAGDSIQVDFYDNAEVDGDSISLYLNGRLLFEHIRLTVTAHSIKIPTANLGAVNELAMVAENLGAIPPNTAYMLAYVNGQRYSARLESTEKSSGVIKLIRR